MARDPKKAPKKAKLDLYSWTVSLDNSRLSTVSAKEHGASVKYTVALAQYPYPVRMMAIKNSKMTMTLATNSKSERNEHSIGTLGVATSAVMPLRTTWRGDEFECIPEESFTDAEANEQTN